jgi:energy-converting hydrogenase Eha subunit G
MGTLSALLHCSWCQGLWFSGFVIFFYFATPLAWPVILILALAGVASFIQILANLAGWSAELKKRTVLGPDHKSTGTCG